MHKYKWLFLSCFLALVISSCNVDEIPNWQPEILAPIVKSTGTVADLSALRDEEYVQPVPSIDIGYPSNVTVNVPPLNIPAVGPYPFEISEFIELIEVDSARLSIQVTNIFPITVSQGTVISFRSDVNLADPSNIVFQHPIDQDISPNEVYTFETLLNNTTVTSDLFLYLEDFQSPGGQNVTFSSQPTEIVFTIDFLEIHLIRLRTNKSIEVSDTSEFEIADADSDNTSDKAEGELVLYTDNTMPTNIRFQIYFLDFSQSSIIDSLFDQPVIIPGATTDANGDAAAVIQNNFTIEVSQDKIRRLEQSPYSNAVFRIDTDGYPGTSVTANRDSKLEMQLVGDLQLNIQL